jgi:hypothetical protein
MTETEKMVRAMNGFFKEMGEDELPFPTGGKPGSELEVLRNVKEEYRRRLLEKIPQYRSLRSEETIPDMFLQALRKRERELTSGAST